MPMTSRDRRSTSLLVTEERDAATPTNPEPLVIAAAPRPTPPTAIAAAPAPVVNVDEPASPAEGLAVAAPEVVVSRQTLELTPARALVLLRGIGTSAPIRAKLAARGYTPAEHARGWGLMQATGGRFDGDGPNPDAEDETVQAAIAEVDAWDEDGLRVVGASLRHRHPAQYAFVMRGLKASTGAEAVVGVSTLLDRLDALEGAPEREGTRAADHAALATLAARGIDEAERARLRARVKAAQSFAGVEGQNRQAEFERRVKAALVEQRAWFEEWSEVARSVVKRRDQLIRLGLASRRPRRPAPGAPVEGPGEEPGEEPVEEPAVDETEDEGAE